MSDDRARRGYETPLVADLETAYRRFLRFQLKVIAGFVVVVALVVAGVLYTIRQRDIDRDRPRPLPSLIGLDNVTAAYTLDRAGFTPLFTRSDRASATIPLGRIVSTDPAPGTRVKPDTLISVTFSCGPPQPPLCNP